MKSQNIIQGCINSIYIAGLMTMLISLFAATPTSTAQTSVFDSINEISEKLNNTNASSIEELNALLNERTQLTTQIKSVLSSADKPSQSPQAKDNHSKQLDEMIAHQYFEFTSHGVAEDNSDAYVQLIHLLRIKEYLEQATDPLQADTAYQINRVNLEKLLVENENAIANLRTEITKIKTPVNNNTKKPETPIAAKKEETPEVFNTTSIIQQIIAAAEESAMSFSPDAAVDNKGFEDRKAFMAWPVNSGSIVSRYSSSSPTIRFSSSSEVVKSICQGEVIYSKKLGGQFYTVVIMHDKSYYSVYSQLHTSRVCRGQRVSYQQNIGEMAQNDQGVFHMKLSVWQKNQSLNPIHWLKNG